MPKRATLMNNTLAVQKSRLKRIAIDYLYAALFFLLISIVVLIVVLTLEDKAHANRILYIVIPFLLVVCAVFSFFSVKRYFLFLAFKRAQFENDATININCKSIRFITYARARSIVDVIGIIFVDVNLKKYVYVLPKALSDSTITRKDIRHKCVGKAVELVCYNGTNLIKYSDTLVELSN